MLVLWAASKMNKSPAKPIYQTKQKKEKENPN